MIDKHRTLYFTDIVNRADRLDPLRTCLELLNKHPSTKSGTYYMNLKGLGLSSLAQVYCDMTSKNGVGVTLIGHDSESRTYVNGYEAAGSYKRKINYDISMEHIVAIMKQSKYCEQFIKYECYQSVLLYDLNDLHGWGGAAVDSGKCACGMTNSCAGGGKCNYFACTRRFCFFLFFRCQKSV